MSAHPSRTPTDDCACRYTTITAARYRYQGWDAARRAYTRHAPDHCCAGFCEVCYPPPVKPLTGADLRCPECGAGAADVAPDLDLTPAPTVTDWMGVLEPASSDVMTWTCTTGHRRFEWLPRRA